MLTLKSLAPLGVTVSKSPLNKHQTQFGPANAQLEHPAQEQALLRGQMVPGNHSALQGIFSIPLPHHGMRKPLSEHPQGWPFCSSNSAEKPRVPRKMLALTFQAAGTGSGAAAPCPGLRGCQQHLSSCSGILAASTASRAHVRQLWGAVPSAEPSPSSWSQDWGFP